jgi:hypothetical protein
MPRGQSVEAQTATDLGISLDRLADPRPAPGNPFVLIEGCGPWSALDHVDAGVAEADHLAAGPEWMPCPLCGGGRLRRSHYCLGCDRSGLDGRVVWPGLGVDEAPDLDYPSRGVRYAPDPVLQGGLGERVRRRTG